MPLRCMNGDVEELAFVHDSTSWDSLRSMNRAGRNLKLPCCGSDVTLKTSKLGNRFFAHAHRDMCASTGETAEHIQAKTIAAQAALECGWNVRTEDRYTDQDGECVVDVCCRKPGSTRGIAIEIQWSKQTDEDTEQRTERYKRHGLRTLWLMKQYKVPVSKSIPAVRIEKSDSGFDVCLPSTYYHPRWINATERRMPESWGQRVPLKTFVMGALRGQFSFGLSKGGRVPIEVRGTEDECRRCKRAVVVITRILLVTETLQDNARNIPLDVSRLGEKDKALQEKVMAAINPHLESIGGAPLIFRYGNTTKESYLSNACGHCRALYWDSYIHEVSWNSRLLFTAESEFTSKELTDCDPGAFERWWFDQAAS